MEAAHIPWRPLGRLLVAKGLLSENELEVALEDQTLTGRRLGEILVELGCVTHAALSLALAEQYGIDLAAETGFGTGLRAQLERRLDEDREPGAGTRPDAFGAAPMLALVTDANAPAREEPAVDPLPLAQLEEQWAKLADAEERLAESERELAALRRAGARRRDQVERLVQRVWTPDLRIAELSRIAEGTEPSPEARHLVFAQLEHRYEIVEREGEPPEANALIELPEIGEARFVVQRVGRSPLPYDARRCVFVQQLHR